MGLFSKDEVKIGDQRFDINGLAAKYNELLDEYDQLAVALKDARTANQQLQAKLGQSDTTVDLLQYQDVVNKYRQTLTKLKRVQDQLAGIQPYPGGLVIAGHLYEIDHLKKLLKNDGKATQQLQTLQSLQAQLKRAQADNRVLEERLQQQADHSSQSADLMQKYLQLQQAKQELANRYQTVMQKNEQLGQQNTQLKGQLQQKQQVEKDLRAQLTTALAQVHQLQQRRQSGQPKQARQMTTTVQQQPVGNVEERQHQLIDRYYQLVQQVLSEYQDQVNDLQEQLQRALSDNGQTEFLQLEESKLSAGAYRQRLTKRNDQMIRYVENHAYQEKLIQRNHEEDNQEDNLRGIRYWGNFVYCYRRALEKLFKTNENLRNDFRFAYHYDKQIATKISQQMPSYLSENNNLKLKTIHSGINDRDEWKQGVTTFQKKAKSFLRGDEGERLVKNVVDANADNRVLTSLNLPYRYQDRKKNSNQIDCIVVNQKGIFILEIKNYAVKQLGINADGEMKVKYRHKEFKHNIVKQGQDHYWAVRDALEKASATKIHMNYLKRNIHVLYVSINSATKLLPAPTENPHYHFVSLDGLRQSINQARGNLRPEIVRDVCDALTNAQQKEKAYDYFCFPANPAKVMERAWEQYTVVQQLNGLHLDDLVSKQDPHIIKELEMAGLKACNGFVTSQPHDNK